MCVCMCVRVCVCVRVRVCTFHKACPLPPSSFSSESNREKNSRHITTQINLFKISNKPIYLGVAVEELQIVPRARVDVRVFEDTHVIQVNAPCD